MSIYLISNNTDIDKSLFQNIKNDDIIVFMNHSYWKKNFNKSISNIFLIGFYYNKKYYESKEHDFKYEKKYYKINNIKIL